MSESFYKNIIRPIFFRMDPEEAHLLVHDLMRQFRPLLPMISLTYKDSDLGCDLLGHQVSNPLGLAAGFDKNGDLAEVLKQLGFGYGEIGSVTALAKQGNPKPRLFRLEKDNAIINRMGLNGQGADAIAKKLSKSRFSTPLGLNIAKTNDPSIVGDAAVADIVYTFNKIRSLPLAYVTINASCPNTKEGIVTESAHMRVVFEEVQKCNTNRLPILVKLSPDSDQQLVEDLVETASACSLAGFVCGNTSTGRDNLTTAAKRIEEIGHGGLSGAPLKSKALILCESVFSLKEKSQIVIGCGGISSGQDAFEFIAAGASFIQIYSGLVFRGPSLPKMICQELSTILKQQGLSLVEAVGSKYQSKAV